MLQLIKDNSIFYLLFLPLFIGSSFVISLAPLAIGILGIIWFLVKARYDYIILIFLLTLILANNRAPTFEGYEQLRVVFVLVLFFLSSFIIFREKGIDQRVNYFLPFFAVGMVSSILFSPVMANSIIKLFSYLILVVSVFVLVKYVLEETTTFLYEHVLVIIAITLIISLFGGIMYPSVFKVSGRLNGVLGNPNFLGLFCVLAYVYTDHFRVENSDFSKRSILLLKVLIVICLFFSGSRNGYAALAIYVITTILLFRGVSGKSVAIILGCGAIIALVEVKELTTYLPFLKELIRPKTISSASGRSIVWPVAIDEIYRQPWLGGGFTYFSYYMPKFAHNHGLHGVYWYGVWNTYLAILLDTGFIGLLAYCYFIFGVIRKSVLFRIVVPFLITMIFTGMFEAWAVSSLNPITPFFLLFFVLIPIYGSRYENFSFA